MTQMDDDYYITDGSYFVVQDSEISLSFTRCDNRYYKIALKSKDMNAETIVDYAEDWDDGNELSFAYIFQEMNNNWKGWDGELSYLSNDQTVELKASHNYQGNIDLAVKVCPEQLPPFNINVKWLVEGKIVIDAGELTYIAGKAEKFFTYYRDVYQRKNNLGN